MLSRENEPRALPTRQQELFSFTKNAHPRRELRSVIPCRVTGPGSRAPLNQVHPWPCPGRAAARAHRRGGNGLESQSG